MLKLKNHKIIKFDLFELHISINWYALERYKVCWYLSDIFCIKQTLVYIFIILQLYL